MGLQVQATLAEGGGHLGDADIILRLKVAVREYVRFYEKVLKLEAADQNELIVIAPFVVIRKNLAGVFELLNKRYDLDIPFHKVSDAERDAVFEESGFHLGPNTERNEYKKRIEELYRSAVSERLVQRASSAYDACMEIVKRKTPEWAENDGK
ncbi:MAG: hypothetical protein ABFE02_02785 [Sulfuricella sp.]